MVDIVWSFSYVRISTIVRNTEFKVFRYTFSETIPIFFNRFKSDFTPCLIATKFSPVIDYGLKFVKNVGFSKIDIIMTTVNKKPLKLINA